MDKKMLVVYYSWSNGNTEKIAEQLADACGADICRIETIETYPSDYDETVEQGHREVDAGYEPAIEALEFDPSGYDVIAVGTPTWWYTMAPAVKTFMGSVDWAGKAIVAFATNGGWAGSTLDDIEDIAAGATAGPSLAVQFDSTGGSRQVMPQQQVDNWIERVQTL